MGGGSRSPPPEIKDGPEHLIHPSKRSAIFSLIIRLLFAYNPA
jgi:hypothetical protein